MQCSLLVELPEIVRLLTQALERERERERRRRNWRKPLKTSLMRSNLSGCSPDGFREWARPSSERTWDSQNTFNVVLFQPLRTQKTQLLFPKANMLMLFLSFQLFIHSRYILDGISFSSTNDCTA